jgi:adenylate cyclase
MTAARRLAAILAADVVGYSRLMGEDEVGTAKFVRERRDAAARIARAFGGRLVQTTGDGVLLEFPSVVAAVECAILIQKMMAERNGPLPEEKRVLYRMGVNLGDVLVEGDDILGDGVNVAARLEGICESGAICLSEDAWRQARGRTQAEFVDLGEQSLKNIAHPVRAYALTPAVIAAVKVESPITAGGPAIPAADAPRSRSWSSRWPALAAALAVALIAAAAYAWHAGFAPRLFAASADENKLANAPHLSIVVLPFENLSSDKEQDYFADGITDDLTTDLSHLPDSFVISRGTAFTYKDKPVDAKAIGRDLGVRYVLEGSVRRVGETITINAQLISTETGAHVWADRFNGERSKLGELQVGVVARLANSLGVELVRAEALSSVSERPTNPDAVDLAMQAEERFNLPDSKATLNDAVILSERALALDPQNVRALTVLTSALILRAAHERSDDRPGDIARAEKTIDAALALQPDNSLVHHARAMVYLAKRQWRSSVTEDETAIALDPNNARAHANAGYEKLFLGRSEEGLAEVETALRLDPRELGALSWWQYYMCALHNRLAHWEQAIEWCEKSIGSAPQVWYPLVELAAANAWAGHDKEAKGAATQLQKIHPGFTVQNWAAIYSSNDPTFNAQKQRIVEGLRKAGLPEGDQKTN